MSLRPIWQINSIKFNWQFSFQKWKLYHQLMSKTLSQTLNLTNPKFSLYWQELFSTALKQVGWAKKSTFLPYKKINKLNSYTAQLNFHPRSANVNQTPLSRDINWTHFLQYWTQVRAKSNHVYTVHQDFRVMFLSGLSPSKSHSLISPSRIYSRWVESLNLLFNLFFINANVQITTNRLFIEEALVFNWHSSLKNHKIFRYLQPIFTFSDVPHGGYIHQALKFITKLKIDFILVVDIKHHSNLVRYFQRLGLYSIGLIPSNYSPWVVSYPIPSLSDSKTTQYFFLKWILSTKNKAKHRRYSSLKHTSFRCY